MLYFHNLTFIVIQKTNMDAFVNQMNILQIFLYHYCREFYKNVKEKIKSSIDMSVFALLPNALKIFKMFGT